MRKSVWVVERFARRSGWRVASIHYTRAAARRQRTRDENNGNKVRLQKYVPATYQRDLEVLEARVVEIAKTLEATPDLPQAAPAPVPYRGEDLTYVGEPLGGTQQTAGTLGGTKF